MDKLINFKSSNINKLTIIFGSKKDNISFNKNINSKFYSNKKNEFFTKYNNQSYKESIYRFDNSFLNTISNKHYKISNEKKIHDKRDYLLIISYKETEKPYSDFSCQKNYYILEQIVTKFIVNDEINLLFIENKKNKCIKIDIILNHNIDNTLVKINDLLDNLCYSQYL